MGARPAPATLIAALLLTLSAGTLRADPAASLRSGPVVVGSKKFTESVLLGEVVLLQLRAAGVKAEHRRELGGTRILFSALQRGDLDVYPEYTGTLWAEILPALAGAALPPPAGRDLAALRRILGEHGLAASAPLGFNNTYALGMREARARELGIRTLSDLTRHPGLRVALSEEFLSRADGWPGLVSRYRLPQQGIRSVDHDLAYRGLVAAQLDVTDLYATDAEIAQYQLRVLEDDLGHFPAYQALLVHRADLGRRVPAAVPALTRLEGRISSPQMVQMNARAKVGRVPETEVAASFLGSAAPPATGAGRPGLVARLLPRLAEHLTLVGLALLAAIAVALPLGVAAARWPRLGQLILAATGILQTIPTLALLVFLIPALGIGRAPALVALFLYGLLPVVRNTHAGLTSIAPALRESAEALGLPAAARLWHVELPLASPAILAGIKTSAVIGVGTATLGALIGAGGLGQPILTGIRLDDNALILEGAIPAALLALAVQGLFELGERWLVPRGLRLERRA